MHPDELMLSAMKKRKRSVKFIALWMILSVLPGVLNLGIEREYLGLMVVEWVYYWTTVATAIGLWQLQKWGRQWAVVMLAVTFLWGACIVSIYIGPFFSPTIFWLSETYAVPEGTLKSLIVFLIIIYLIWPIVALSILSHPHVCKLFEPPQESPLEADA